SIFLFQSFRVKKTAPAPATQTEKIVDALPKETPKILPQAPLNEKPSIPAVYPVEIPDSVSFSGEATPLDIFYVREYLDRELIVNTYFHSSTLLLLKRANRWFPVIEPILARYKIPNDFKYLAMIESGFENVVSPAGATGYWQFLSHTAREYGLEVNSGIDERYNVEKSTEAACKYLIDAYEKYGNWTLVAAAYNAGKRRITEEIELQKVNNYYDLLLNQETARYIFRILAIKTIFENPENYGFHIEAGDLYPVIPTENIEVTKTVKSLVDFAREHNITYKILKYFNPWLRKDHLPNRSGRTYLIKIPVEGSINYPALVKSQSRTAD
ncbi:MAG: lytic transglycosylase domain-containing protein, partial [Bacteroidales bacterium]|nr:lytic transglycosylase domain-containing protein [Bacteroidales bacterium]